MVFVEPSVVVVAGERFEKAKVGSIRHGDYLSPSLNRRWNNSNTKS